MTHDFEGALREYKACIKDEEDGAGYLWDFVQSNPKTIQLALRIADRLQKGEVTAGMQCILDLHCSYEYPRKETFKAMSQKLFEECEDETSTD